ncbi:hypothetical protein GZ78_14215 [Endozoicomonas numazuensis]|uniref:Uncharacterized protein n=1 Tax=Endozoicomonas numazuensis TaxID=1137799 RepID=A0A081NF30_9GAMM|nr:hypothetical protein GZ78_14215 [Endozoicomonas numazuensis]
MLTTSGHQLCVSASGNGYYANTVWYDVVSSFFKTDGIFRKWLMNQLCVMSDATVVKKPVYSHRNEKCYQQVLQTLSFMMQNRCRYRGYLYLHLRGIIRRAGDREYQEFSGN